MGAEDVRALVQRAVSLWNSHDRQAYVDLTANDGVLTAPSGTRLEGRAGSEQFYDMWQSAFKDTSVEPTSIIADDSNACLEAVFKGSHTGTLMSPMGEIPATGKKVAVPFTNVLTIRGGKIANARLYFDTAELVAQLGLAPATPTSV
jgi:steroid delta-isomerase-like uncharacterized protein